VPARWLLAHTLSLRSGTDSAGDRAVRTDFSPSGLPAGWPYLLPVSGERPKSGRHTDSESEATPGQLVIDFEAERVRRLRWGQLPKPPAEVKVPYAKRHDEDDTDEGEVIAWLMTRPEWLETFGAECDAIEAERPRRGPKASYSTRELEAAIFFQWMTGCRTYRAARNRLAGDRGARARAALGFAEPRETRCPQELRLMAGVPSEATLSRHRKRFPDARRLEVYRAYFDRLRKMNAQDPELREGLRFLNIDGSAQPTSFTCPVYGKSPDGGKTRGPLLNASRVTCDEGSTMSNDVPLVKQGMGFGVVPLTCINALPWAYEHGTITIKARPRSERCATLARTSCRTPASGSCRS
jgi:hypothetical protein